MGARKEDGHEYKAANGYWYVKVDGKFVLKHHIIAGQHRGAPISQGERVTFRDKNPDNLSPENLIVAAKKGGKQARIHYLQQKIKQYQEELDELTR